LFETDGQLVLGSNGLVDNSKIIDYLAQSNAFYKQWLFPINN
jgi:hypothetical protein